MNNKDQIWQRLAEAARRAPDDGRDVAAPYGFAVRVAAIAMSGERPRFGGLERISLRAVLVAGVLALAAMAANYSVLVHLFDDASPAADDPVAELVDIIS